LFPSLAVIGTLAILTLRKVRHERRRAESERGRRERANRFAVHSLTSLVGTRDLATGKHARRTQEYARLLATQLAAQPRFRASLAPEYVDLIARLAPLHDIGKVGVRDAVLHKPGPLSAEEFDEMRRHPSFGYDTLLNAERLAGEAGGTTKRSCASRKRSSTRTTNVGTAKDILGASRVRRSRSAGASWPW
jgi:response regulator RpfG family c-di-GMP phosphodiesterase